MGLKTRSLCFSIVFIAVVESQIFDQRHHATLQDIVGYSKQFRYNRNVKSQPANEPLKSSNLQKDPVFRELFKEFLSQYQQLYAQQKAATDTTTTTIPSPFRFEFPTAPTIQNIPVQPHRPIANAQPAPEVTQSTLRVAPRRKFNNPAAARINLELVSITTRTPEKVVQQAVPKFDEQEFRRQAESAKYQFASEIDDEINGNLHQREEVRDGLAVKGKYSYSDGYYKRTVHYEADDKGYRVVKEAVEPLKGPQTNPDGYAKVTSYIDGKVVNYQITSHDILKRHHLSLIRR